VRRARLLPRFAAAAAVLLAATFGWTALRDGAGLPAGPDVPVSTTLASEGDAAGVPGQDSVPLRRMFLMPGPGLRSPTGPSTSSPFPAPATGIELVGGPPAGLEESLWGRPMRVRVPGIPMELSGLGEAAGGLKPESGRVLRPRYPSLDDER
jgi:hypothetical protein